MLGAEQQEQRACEARPIEIGKRLWSVAPVVLLLVLSLVVLATHARV